MRVKNENARIAEEMQATKVGSVFVEMQLNMIAFVLEILYEAK